LAEGIVHDQRHTVLHCHCFDRREIRHIEARVTDALDVCQPGTRMPAVSATLASARGSLRAGMRTNSLGLGIHQLVKVLRRHAHRQLAAP
jgi:hypothetical protein